MVSEATQSWDSWKRTAPETKKRGKKRAAVSRGATRAPAKQPKSELMLSPKVLKRVALVSVLLLVALGGYIGIDNYVVPEQTHFAINEVEVTGNYQHLDMSKVSSIIHGYSDGDFFNVDIDVLREALVALPWVREVALRREWPNKLVVELHEQQAVAVWKGSDGSMQLLNDQAEAFSGISQINPSQYPTLGGADNSQMTVLKEYAELYARFKQEGVTVTGLSVDARNTWTGTLGNGMTFRYLGKNRDTALQRLRYALTTFSSSQLNNIESIDLRYSNGFAVAEKEGQQPQS